MSSGPLFIFNLVQGVAHGAEPSIQARLRRQIVNRTVDQFATAVTARSA